VKKRSPLIIVGDSAFAEVACEYFTVDSEYEVVAFSVERNFLKRDRFLGLPVVPFEELQTVYSPSEHWFFAATVYTQSNKLRARLFESAKAKGFTPASFVSPHAFVWRDVALGEHCFIFENNVIQPRVQIGNNVVLWSGNHVGHHSTVKDHCFISSHVVISGFVNVGAYCFLGVNATIANNITIGDHCTIGAGALILRDVNPYKVIVGTWKGEKPEGH